MARRDERELFSLLAAPSATTFRNTLVELSQMRLERHTDALISTNCDIIRGKAQEMREFLQEIERGIDNHKATK